MKAAWTHYPITGFMLIVRESEVRDLDWTISEAMNTIVSGGIISPERPD